MPHALPVRTFVIVSQPVTMNLTTQPHYGMGGHFKNLNKKFCDFRGNQKSYMHVLLDVNTV